ncbi:DUF736 domain-containing protein [Novosphingobium sp. 1949]|uniref:DUF736 domain-containing protein n=1 Tax=Novosphingobium organovorum TaxID=2930092 RepID=A0ABT0BBZ1_9SPHN|nr:DUF736 family protein [Novosphingobium organovorum]MCJ2182388.1 DUF736 domain-containing protein [Novosphingobium organovorum]
MPAIGYVTRDGNGFKGQLRTLSIRTEIESVPNTRKSGDTQPDFRVSAAGVEVGAGWVRRGEMSGRDYVSLSLAAPEFGPRRLYANLGRAAGQDDEDAFAIIWNPAD